MKTDPASSHDNRHIFVTIEDESRWCVAVRTNSSDAEAAWKVEIERRVAAIEAGTVRLDHWEDVKRRVEKEILGR